MAKNAELTDVKTHEMDSQSSYNLAVPNMHLVYSEILSVTSAMRKNSRWATPTTYYPSSARVSLASSLGLRAATSNAREGRVQGRKNTDLMVGFEDLKRDVRASTGEFSVNFFNYNTQLSALDLSEIPLTAILAPFLALIRSEISTPPIISASLSSLHSFFVCGLISPNSPELRPALSELSNTVSHCKFDAGNTSADEAVIFRILTVVRDCICGPVGPLLGDIEVCEMLETVLTTCCNVRLGGKCALITKLRRLK